MKIWLKRISTRLIHLDIFIINIIGLVIGIYLYFTLERKIEIIGACLAATISISVGWRTYKIEDDKMFKELFESFNERYDGKFNEKLNEINNESTDIDERLVVDYLNFCSEEYLWFKKKRIPYNVWSAWREGILFHLKKGPIKVIVEREQDQKNSYYGLFDDLGVKGK